MNNDIFISVVCNAYNHENYIKDALDGFVMQKTKVKYEVLIHDDASTDSTADIIREYEKKYPDIIKPIYQTENQYSQGISILEKFHLPRAQGKYIALCEGDDYWTDPNKLQKQFDAMEKHPEIDMCAHTVDNVEQYTKKVISVYSASDYDTVFSVEQIIKGGGGFLPTNSLFFRKELYENVPEFRKKWKFDYTLQINGALRGGILYLHDNMGAYRPNADGSWTRRYTNDKSMAIKHKEKLCEMLRALDKETDYKYTDVIKKQIKKQEFALFEIKDDYKSMKSKEYKENWGKLNFMHKLKINIKHYFPWLLKIRRRLKGVGRK